MGWDPSQAELQLQVRSDVNIKNLREHAGSRNRLSDMRDEMASSEVKSLQVTFVVRGSNRPKRREVEHPQAMT
jgi:hypothetical protein